MPDNSKQLHEDPRVLTPESIDRHRALTSIEEELEAIDWYAQRVEATQDPELKAVLAHNRDEEKEHAILVMEWLRRHDSAFDEKLREYLFSPKPLAQVVAEEKSGAADEGGGSSESGGSDGSLGIGSLREVRR